MVLELMSDSRNHLALEFELLVTDKFSFLQTEFSYEQYHSKVPNLELSHGDECAVFFGNSDIGICVEVSLDFEIYSVDVVLLESEDGTPITHSVWGQSEHAPAVLLSALVDRQASADGEHELLLPPSLPSISWREKKRRFKQRQTAVSNQLADVVQSVADRLMTFAADVLCGDTSDFAEIQAFYRDQQNVTLSSDGLGSRNARIVR